jgi:hypothetical protein
MAQLLKVCKPKTECDFPYRDPVTKEIKNSGCKKRIPTIKFIDSINMVTEYAATPQAPLKKEPFTSVQLYNILRRIDPKSYFMLGCDEK